MTKKRLKENYVLKQERKIESEVFDHFTLKILAKIMKKGLIATVDYPINTGKEANVFHATSPEGAHLAVKIYKIETAPFFRKEDYLAGDPRFRKIKNNSRDIVFAFARKEFKNLELSTRAGVNCPKPFYVNNNVLVMSFIGEENLPYPTLNVVGPNSESDLDSVLDDIKKMYGAKLVHADLSEFNIILADKPYLIDFGQAVLLQHPKSNEFLERDVRNVLHYFSKFGFKRDLEKTLEWIKK